MLDLFRSRFSQWRRLIPFVIIAGITVMSGCATKLGYVPEDVEPSDVESSDEATTMTPTYIEVKRWAYEVADGYDSRATLNRYAIYGGALIGAAAASAIAGLAAFDSGSSALIGIPIGAAFLGSVAAVYSNEVKARIYRLGTQYIKDLITLSDKRLYQCQASTSTISQDAQKAVDDAQTRLENARDHEKLLQERAKKAHEDVEKSQPGKDKDLEAKIATDIDSRKSEAAAAAAEAKANLGHAQQDEQDARQCSTLKPEKQSNSTTQPRETKQRPDKKQLLEKEALCLRQDVNDVMRKVEAFKAELDPDDIVKRLKDVRAPSATPAAGTTSGTGSAASSGNAANTTTVPPVDLAALSPPVKSQCGQF